MQLFHPLRLLFFSLPPEVEQITPLGTIPARHRLSPTEQQLLKRKQIETINIDPYVCFSPLFNIYGGLEMWFPF